MSEMLSRRANALVIFGLDETTAQHIDCVEETARELRRLIEGEDDKHTMRVRLLDLLAEYPWLMDQ